MITLIIVALLTGVFLLIDHIERSIKKSKEVSEPEVSIQVNGSNNTVKVDTTPRISVLKIKPMYCKSCGASVSKLSEGEYTCPYCRTKSYISA